MSRNIIFVPVYRRHKCSDFISYKAFYISMNCRTVQVCYHSASFPAPVDIVCQRIACHSCQYNKWCQTRH
jgi:hypothetical protein